MENEPTEKNVRDVMELSGSERFMMGIRMFEEFRAEIIASMPKDLPPNVFKQELFKRIYGAPMEDFLSGKVTDSDIAHQEWP